ncbi:MAG: hypothetical protein GQ581_09650 [Methyloprofundus sp.]|nr:hypothetical protein [Methyloprofundus sp.]
MRSCTAELLTKDESTAQLTLSGDWVMGNIVPSFSEFESSLNTLTAQNLIVKTELLISWDSRFVLFIYQLQAYCQESSIKLNLSGLPISAQGLLKQVSAFPIRESGSKQIQPKSFIASVGVKTQIMTKQSIAVFNFVGEVCLSLSRLLRGKASFRRQDLWLMIQECGPNALGIVTLISVLVGLILAFVGAMQLKIFGAQIYVANLVGLGMAREMGAMMTAIIMAGRTGAAYASQLGSMQVNEEIDALKTLGISPIDFLVLPRLIALVLMLPLLCIYADFLGIIGGLLVSVTLLDISLMEYVTQTQSALQVGDFATGLIKSSVFGVLVAISGCMSGMRSGRSSSSVGDAATSAVVAGIVSIVIADASLTVIYQIIGL